MSNKVLIVQPYIPTYREALFDRLVAILAAEGITCQVAAPFQLDSLAHRGDQTTGQPWRLLTRGRSWRTPWAEFSSYGSLPLQRGYDALVLPAAASCLDAQFATWRRGTRRPKVALWGHIATYVREANPLDSMIERTMMRRADHVFTYTQSGTRTAIQAGVNSDRVTTLMNTINTDELVQAVEQITPRLKEQFRHLHGLEGTTACYFGALDESKMIDLLAEALDDIWDRDPRFRLIVGGQGNQASLLSTAVTRGQVVLLGRVDAQAKALAASASSVIVNPGRIGLLAVDALVLRLPIITTYAAHHAPEVEYLQEGQDVYTVSNDPGMLAASILATRSSDRNHPRTPPPTLDEMTSRFASGIRSLLT